MIKNIYIYWRQGYDDAPFLVKKCIQSWKFHNKDWTIIFLDNTNLHNYIKVDDYIDLSNKHLLDAHASDIIRLIILKEHGGVWADATTFCNRPLNDWLPKYISEGFFAFDKPWPNLKINVWWFYAEKDSYIISEWLTDMIAYYRERDKAHTYHIMTFLFHDLYNLDDKFKEIYDRVPKISGIPARYLFECGFFNKLTDEIKIKIDDKQTPIYKLSYKCDNCDVIEIEDYDTNLILYYLYATID